jgi:hypothetical protein
VKKAREEQMRMILDSHRPLLEFIHGNQERDAYQVMVEHLSLRWGPADVYASRGKKGGVTPARAAARLDAR